MVSIRLFRAPRRALLRVCALLAMLSAVAAVGSPGRANAHRACGVETLRGSYVFAASGSNIVNGVAQPKAIVEAIDFNGDGTLEVAAATVSINGMVNRGQPGVGTYMLDDTCTGTVTLAAGPSFDIFTDQRGEQAWMIQTNPNTVSQGTVTKISRRGVGDER